MPTKSGGDGFSETTYAGLRETAQNWAICWRRDCNPMARGKLSFAVR
jgi:hypothetical protein